MTTDQAAKIPTAKVDAADRERIAAGLLLLVDPADALEAAIARIAYLEERNDELQQDVARLTSDLGQARETISALTSSRARHLGERNDARAEVDRLAALLAAAEEGAEKQRQAACNLRDPFDRVATAAGVADGGGDEVADRIVAAIDKLRKDRDVALDSATKLRVEIVNLRDALATARRERDEWRATAKNGRAPTKPEAQPVASPAQVDTPPAPTEPKPPRYKVAKSDDVPPATAALWFFARSSADVAAGDLNAGRGTTWKSRRQQSRPEDVVHYAVIDTRPEEG